VISTYRARLRFSVRALLALVGIAATVCGFVARELAIVRAEDLAGELLEAAIAGESEEALRAASCGVCISRAPPGSKWRRAIYWLAGSPGEVGQMRIVGQTSLRVLDERARALRHVQWLQMVPRTPTGEIGPITQDHISVASHFRSLERLTLHGCLSEDIDISPLAHVRIDTLRIKSDVFPSNVVKELASLNTFTLDLVCQEYNFAFPANVFASFGDFSSVRRISISNCEVDDRGFELIAQAPNLNALSCRSSSITDEGLRRASGRLHVYHLDIGCAEITDGSVEVLAGMKDLSFLHIERTRISPEGLARLRALRPDLDVKY
jgi:hypothetical protein